MGAPGFFEGERTFTGGQFALKPGQGGGGIMRHPVSVAAISLQSDVLTGKVGEALFGGFQLAGEGGEAVALRVAIIAPVEQQVAGSGKRCGGAGLRALRGFGFVLRGGDKGIGTLRFGSGGIGGGGGIAPAGKDQPRFGHADAVG